MEKLCFTYPRHIRMRIAHHCVAAALILCALPISPHAAADESIVHKELTRRINNAREAYELLNTADTAYKKGDYETATQEYARAFNLLPSGALNHELRSAAADRYATAATERSRALAKNGSYAEARTLLDTVLKAEVAPAHAGALKLRQQVDDPIRYNHAITPDHVEDVVKVGRLLRQAEGSYNLGQYNQANQYYESTLQIDPFNKAARRGMERISAIKSDYYRAARDHTRSAMLGEVDKNWELYVPAAETIIPAINLSGPLPSALDLRDKLAGITVDNIDLDNFTLAEAIDFVRAQSRLGDAPDLAGEQSGINIVINLGDPLEPPAKAVANCRVNLSAEGLPLTKILDYITDQTRTKWRVDGISVLITPIGTTGGGLISKTFRVPPHFLQSATIQEENDDDPFEGANDFDGKLPEQLSITDFLKKNGITFPDGATAMYAPSANTLMVRNTPGNIDLVDQLISIIASEEPVMVIIRTTIIRVNEEKLKELGFDWAITPLDLGSGLFLGGGSIGNGTNLIPLSGDPITSGNRSGNKATNTDPFNAFLGASQSNTFVETSRRAPGILKVTAITNGMMIEALMRGLDQQTGADVMVRPSTITRSGEGSRIEVIREFIYPTEYEPAEVPQITAPANTTEVGGGGGVFPVTPTTPSAFETRNIGVTMDVLPTAGPEKKYIELSLRPEFVEFEGFVNYGAPIFGLGSDRVGNPVTIPITNNAILLPVFKIIRTQNVSMTIQDGATVVLGGLITNRKTKIEDKTPILGDIPYAGRLFRSEADRTFREAIIMTVNAELVDPTGNPWRNR